MLSLVTRQYASAFNQPLSFDTSSVTSMRQMFKVRSARTLPSASTVGASLLLAPPTTPLHPPACLPPHVVPPPMPPLSTRQSATAFNQPLSFDTSSVTDMEGMFHVRSALSLHSWAFPARCLHRRHFRMPSCLPARLSPLLPCLPSTPQHADGLSDANKLLIRCALQLRMEVVIYNYYQYDILEYESEWSSLGPCPTSAPPAPPPRPVPRAVLQPRQCVTTADGVSRCIQIQEGLSLDDEDVQAMIERHFASLSPS